jgi:hypothetical protein
MRTLNDYFITAEIEDISTVSSTFVAIPDGGKVIKIITALQDAISGANAAITFEVGGTAMTNSAITVATQVLLQEMLIHLNQLLLTQLKKMALSK